MFQWMKQKLNDWSFARDRRKYSEEGKFYEISGLWTDKDGEYHNDLDRIEHGLPFRILQGPYKNIIFCFTKLVFRDSGEVSFQIHVLNKNKQEVKRDPRFIGITRKILLNILYKLYNSDEHLSFGIKPGEEYYENRTDHPEEPHKERTIRPKGPPIS